MKTSALPILLILLLFEACTPRVSWQTIRNESSTTIRYGDTELLQYVHAETPAPDSASPLYARAAYIHPLRSPGGAILTGIQPPDHMHHYGIWAPWTHTHFLDSGNPGPDGDHAKGLRRDTIRHVDFWNLHQGQGTVRFDAYLHDTACIDEARLGVRHRHVFFRPDGSEGTAIREKWHIRAHSFSDTAYLLDLAFHLETPLDSGIVFEQWRYGGGLGFRATEAWGEDNCSLLTSEGLTRDEADASLARWVILEGLTAVDQGRSGVLIMSHPDNHTHPEPIRMWTADSQGGKGNLFFNFTPTRHQEWWLPPGKEAILRYRILVYDGSLDAGKADKAWNKFSGQVL